MDTRYEKSSLHIGESVVECIRSFRGPMYIYIYIYITYLIILV